MTAVLVIGMHRSGTSLVAGAIHLAGAYLGPEKELMPATPENAKGYWEHLGIVGIDERLTALLGASWYNAPAVTAEDLESEPINALQGEARGLIADEVEVYPLWACKDPRMTVLLPFWRPIIRDPRFIVCVRNPVDVARSLLKRDGIPIEQGVALWHIYTLRALFDTSPSERVIVFYEEILRDPIAALAPAFSLIGAEERLADPQVRQAIESFADPKLSHSSHAKNLGREPGVLSETKKLYKALVDREERRLENILSRGEEQMEVFGAVAGAYARAYEATRTIDQLRRDLHLAQAALQNTRDVLDSRAHRAAARINSWLIRIKGGATPP